MFDTQHLRANRRTFRTRFVAGADAARRAILAFGLAASVLTSTLGPTTTPDVAAEPSDPSARLQLVVKSVKIHDDKETLLAGEGELRFFYGVWRCKEGVPTPCRGTMDDHEAENLPSSVSGEATALVRAGSLFNASTGDTVTLDRQVPQAGDAMWGEDTSPELGFAVLAGRPAVLRFEMNEWDGQYFDDELGYVHYLVGVEDLGIGTHTIRSIRDGGASVGDFTVTFEIRRVPFADLKPVNIKILDLPGNAKKQVCMAVQNLDVVHAGAFEVALHVDDKPVPGGRYTIGVLASGTSFDACVIVALPTSGRHKLSAIVDGAGVVIESNEANNLYEKQYDVSGLAATADPASEPTTASTPSEPATAPTAEPKPTATSSKDQPDLLVSAIKVNGRVPDGKDDCKDGKNDVTVIVKNQGTKKAGDFVVQLVVDGDQGGARQQGLDNLEAGKEASITFGDVTLRKGSHTLAATADSTSGIAESNETNNTRTATASCKDD